MTVTCIPPTRGWQCLLWPLSVTGGGVEVDHSSCGQTDGHLLRRAGYGQGVSSASVTLADPGSYYYLTCVCSPGKIFAEPSEVIACLFVCSHMRMFGVPDCMLWTVCSVCCYCDMHISEGMGCLIIYHSQIHVNSLMCPTMSILC